MRFAVTLVLPITLTSDLLIQPIKSNVELKIQPRRHYYITNITIMLGLWLWVYMVEVCTLVEFQQLESLNIPVRLRPIELLLYVCHLG